MEALVIILLLIIIWLLISTRQVSSAPKKEKLAEPSEIDKLALQFNNLARREGNIVSRFILRPSVIYRMIDVSPEQSCDSVIQEFQTNLGTIPFNLTSDVADKLREIYTYLVSHACVDGLDKAAAKTNIARFVSMFP